jgi:hypothetical protein
VLIVALLGEAWDIYDRSVIGASQVYAGNWHVIWNMMFWPTAIMLMARFAQLLKP